MLTLACLAAVLAAAPAAAAPRLLVAPLKSPPQLTYTGKRVAETVAREATRIGGYDVQGPEDIEALYGRKAVLKLMECGDDARCLAEVARPLGADRVVAGFLSKGETNYRVSLVHADVKSGRSLATFAREIPIASRRLLPDVAAATPALLRGEAEAQGTLVISCNVPDADVFLDEDPLGKTPLTRKVKPGKHQVQVSKPGYIQQDPHWVDVAAGETTRHEFRLYTPPARAPAKR